MTLRKPKASKTQARNKASIGVETAVWNWIDETPDVRLVLEIATRANALKSREPPRHIGIAANIAVTSPNSQYPVP